MIAEFSGVGWACNEGFCRTKVRARMSAGKVQASESPQKAKMLLDAPLLVVPGCLLLLKTVPLILATLPVVRRYYL